MKQTFKYTMTLEQNYIEQNKASKGPLCERHYCNIREARTQLMIKHSEAKVLRDYENWDEDFNNLMFLTGFNLKNTKSSTSSDILRRKVLCKEKYVQNTYKIKFIDTQFQIRVKSTLKKIKHKLQDQKEC